MSDYILISGRTVSNLVVSAGTYLEIGSGGVAMDTLVKDGGYETVFSGGITISTTVRAGGDEQVSSGGTAIETAVKDGGYIMLGPGGIASSAAVSGGGTMIVSAGGAAYLTNSAAAAIISVTNLVGAGQTISGVTIGSSAPLDVGSGGHTLSVTIVDGGTETVSSGGAASATVVSSGATLEILSGASAADTTVASGGTFIVLSGGAATGTVIGSGAQGSVDLVVGSGLVSSGLVADAITSITVLSGGLTSGTTVTSGGTEVVAAMGRAVGTVVSVGGYELVSGTSIDAVVSGAALIQGGTTSGLTVTGDGTVSVENSFLGFSVLSNTTITGQGTLTVSDGNDVTGALVFGGAASVVIMDAVMPFATLSGFTAANTLDLAAVPYASGGTVAFSDGSLVIDEGGQTYVLQFDGTYADDAFSIASDPFSGTLVTVSDPPCFLAGTMIATPGGAVAVERLSLGDLVLTEGGGVAPITWIGSRRIDCNRHADPARIWPVRIGADAFAPGRPMRNLYLSPDHAVFAEGVLIPVKHLINGRSIAQVAAHEVTYYHLELPQHAVILAEGLAVESYLDTGDRSAFTGGEGPRALHPVFGSERADIALMMEALGCAPLRVTGPEVVRVRAALAHRILGRVLGEAAAAPGSSSEGRLAGRPPVTAKGQDARPFAS